MSSVWFFCGFEALSSCCLFELSFPFASLARNSYNLLKRAPVPCFELIILTPNLVFEQVKQSLQVICRFNDLFKSLLNVLPGQTLLRPQQEQHHFLT